MAKKTPFQKTAQRIDRQLSQYEEQIIETGSGVAMPFIRVLHRAMENLITVSDPENGEHQQIIDDFQIRIWELN